MREKTKREKKIEKIERRENTRQKKKAGKHEEQKMA